jgi:hypothetical protein
VFAPLRSAAGGLVGVLSVDVPHDRRRPRLLQREIVEMFAAQAGIAIENAQLTQRLTSASRRGDTVARLGGDEFVVIAHKATLQDAERLGRRLRRAVAAPIRVNQTMVRFTITIGIALSAAPVTSRHCCAKPMSTCTNERQMPNRCRDTEPCWVQWRLSGSRLLEISRRRWLNPGIGATPQDISTPMPRGLWRLRESAGGVGVIAISLAVFQAAGPLGVAGGRL